MVSPALRELPSVTGSIHGTPILKKSATGFSKKWLKAGWLTTAVAKRSIRRIRAFCRWVNARQYAEDRPRDGGMSAPSMNGGLASDPLKTKTTRFPARRRRGSSRVEKNVWPNPNTNTSNRKSAHRNRATRVATAPARIGARASPWNEVAALLRRSKASASRTRRGAVGHARSGTGGRRGRRRPHLRQLRAGSPPISCSTLRSRSDRRKYGVVCACRPSTLAQSSRASGNRATSMRP